MSFMPHGRTPAERTLTERDRALVLHVATQALASFLLWWPAPSATVCWHVIFGSLRAVQGDDAEILRSEVLRKQTQLFLATGNHDIKRIARDTAEKAVKLRRKAVLRSVYLLESVHTLPLNAGAERYVLEALRKPQSNEMPLYRAQHGAAHVSLAPGAMGASGPAGISRDEAVAGMEAFAKASEGIVAIAAHGVALSFLDLQRIISAATLKHTAKVDTTKLYRATFQRLAPFVWRSFCAGSDSFHLRPSVDLKYLASSPLACLLKAQRAALKETIDEVALKELFQRVWATMARDGDYIAAVLELLLRSKSKHLRAHVTKALDAAQPGQDEFLGLTRALFESFPAPERDAKAQVLIVASNESDAALLHIMQEVVLKGHVNYNLEELSTRLWPASLLLLLEARDHGYLSRKNPRYHRIQSACAVAFHPKSATSDLEARMRYLVGASSRAGAESPFPLLSGPSARHFYWYFACRQDLDAQDAPCVQAWKEARGAQNQVASVAFASTLAALAHDSQSQSDVTRRALAPEVLEDLLSLIIAQPGAALLLYTAVALPPANERGSWTLRVLHRLGILTSDTPLGAAASGTRGYEELGALLQGLCAIDILPSLEDGEVLPLELWVHALRALHFQKWSLPYESLVKRLVPSEQGAARREAWGWPEGALRQQEDGARVEVALVPTADHYALPICVRRNDGPEAYYRIDPWGSWINLFVE